MMRLLRLSIVAAAALIALAPGAQAAPQMLGVVATATPVELNCADGYCSAEFSAFCLERERGVPEAGTAYRTVGAADLTLVATLSDGSTRAMPAQDAVTVRTERGYSAVRIGVAQDWLNALGAERLALKIGEAFSLAPVPVAGDPEAHTAEDLARGAGPLRRLAVATVDEGGVRTEAARVINRVINRLPDDAPGDARAWATAWAEAVGGAPDMFHADQGMADASFNFLACRQSVAGGQGDTLRRCLQYRHDALMTSQNLKYWDAIKVGM